MVRCLRFRDRFFYGGLGVGFGGQGFECRRLMFRV